MLRGMSLSRYYRDHVTWVPTLDDRLTTMARIVVDSGASDVLDVGCGSGVLLDELAKRIEGRLVGLDAANVPGAVGWQLVRCDLTVAFPLSAASMDVVVAGEIIEHVPNPDRLLRECHRVLRPEGLLVLSTPNLVSWANRILVPLGVQPLFTETSSEAHLGRRWRALGQGNDVQGHLKVFTHRSLGELLVRCGFTVVDRKGMAAEFPSGVDRIDRVFARTVSLASDLLYTARRSSVLPTPPVARSKKMRGRPKDQYG